MGVLAAKALTRPQSGGLRELARGTRNFAVACYQRWLDARFDRKYGIDTRGVNFDLAAMGVGAEHLAEVNGYEAIQIPMFRAMMRAAGIDPRRYAFVDIGCGKGRALVLAAEWGFRRIIGVELAPALYHAARANLDAYRRRRPRASPIEVRCGDAVKLPLPDGDALLYFYNPFGEGMMRKMAANIARAYRAAPRNLVIVYRNPVHLPAFDELNWLRLRACNKSFAIYA